MSFKDKIMNKSMKHPKLVTFGIGLAITFIVVRAVGMMEHQVFAEDLPSKTGNVVCGQQHK
jgi:hypothetical protein